MKKVLSILFILVITNGCREVVYSKVPDLPPGEHPPEADTVHMISYQPKLPDRFYIESVFRALLSDEQNEEAFEGRLSEILNENIVYNSSYFSGGCFWKKKRGDTIENIDGCSNETQTAKDDYLNVSSSVTYVGIIENVCKEFYQEQGLVPSLVNSLDLNLEEVSIKDIEKIFEVFFNGNEMTNDERDRIGDFIEQSKDEDISNDDILKDIFFSICKQEAWLLI